jgi:hypothetical protein
MNYELKILNPIQYEGWNDLLIPTPNTSFFHTVSWTQVLSESYSYRPTYFTILNHHKQLSLLIPMMEIKSILTGRRGVSLPFTDYCEPIVDKPFPFTDVLEDVIRYGNQSGWNSFELRGGKRYLPNEVYASRYFHHILDLSHGEQNIFLNFRDSTQRNIKKAISNGVQVKIDTSFESVNDFYKLNSMTRKMHGLPTQPRHFFNKLCDHILSNKMGFVALASFKEHPIAGAIYFYFKEKAIYKYGASDNKYWPLRANNLVMWKAIQWCCQNGLKNLCLGRTEPEHRGLRQFKSGWGTQEDVIYYYKYDFKKNAFITNPLKKREGYRKVLRKMPIGLLNLIGSVVYRHMG